VKQIIVGVDEVGRGPWAGPVASAAVALYTDTKLYGIKDSKLLNHRQRMKLAGKIRQRAVGIGIGWASHSEIDEFGLTQATRLCMQRAVSYLGCQIDEIIIDGNYNYLAQTHPAKAVVKADRSYKCVSAASIIAKVARDFYMQKMAHIYPGYGFEFHVGYGTKLHLQKLQEFGASPIHRRSYLPVMNQLQLGLTRA